MHREIRRLLPRATGFSEFAIAVTVDIRDFSSFASDQDATGVAEFVKRFYTRVIDGYFPRPRFYKPTGDGLLIVRPYSERTLAKVATDCVSASLRLVSEFSALFADDPMLNFSLPDRLGIGLSRGAVCGLGSGDRIIDYSGRCLNLSSRMMDFARPSGVVLDGGFGVNLLPAALAERFAEGAVCIRGVAPRKPMGIYYTKEYTTLSPRAADPVEATNWETQTSSKTLRQLRNEAGPWFIHWLTARPFDPEDIRVQVSYPDVKGGRRVKGVNRLMDLKDVKYDEVANKPRIRVNYGELASVLEKFGVRSTWKVTITIVYPTP